MKKSMAIIASVLVIVAAVSIFTRHKAYAQGTIAYTAPGTLTGYSIGYGIDFVEFTTSAPYQQNGCTNTSGYYATNPTDAANKQYEAAVLGATLSGKRIQVGVSGCDSQGRPVVVAMSILP